MRALRSEIVRKRTSWFRGICIATLGSLTFTSFSSSPARAEQTYNVHHELIPGTLYKEQLRIQELLRNEQIEDADTESQKLLEAYPQFSGPHFLRAFVLERQDKRKEALKEARESVRINDRFPDGWQLTGNLCILTGDVSGALESFKKFKSVATTTHPRYTQVANSIASLERELESRKKRGDIASDSSSYISDVTASGIVHWAKESMPIKIYIEDASGRVNGYKNQYSTILESSFRAWEQAADGAFTLKFVGSKPESDVYCTWTDDLSKLADPSEGGHTEPVIKQQGITGGEVVLLTVRQNEQVTDAWIHQICLHEAGHMLGLLGHSTDPDDIMFMAGKMRRTEEPSLSSRDTQTIRKLYSLKQTAFNPDNRLLPDTPIGRAVKLNNQANQAMQDGNYELAIQNYKAALAIKSDLRAAKENLAAAICNSALPLVRTGDKAKIAKGVNLLEQAIEMQEKLGGKENLIKYLTNYRISLDMLGRQDDASRVQKRLDTLTNTKTATGARPVPVLDTPERAISLNNEGSRALRDNNCDLAIAKFKEALDVKPDFKIARRNLVVAISNSSIGLLKSGKKENYEKAVKLLEDAIEMQEQDDPNSDSLKYALNNYGAALQRLGRLDDAAKVKVRLDSLKAKLK